MRNKLCKLQGCDRPRYNVLRLCWTHVKEKEKKKRDEKNARRLERKLSSKKHQQSELKKWRAKTWKLMSEWVRRKDAGFSDQQECYTCKVHFPWKELHCGHYQHGKLDFDERNLKPQCASCNTYHGGRLDSYTLRLISEHGLEWVEQLKRDAAQHGGYSLEDCKRIHGELKEKLSKL